MRAHIKINIHFDGCFTEDPKANEVNKYPIQVHHAGVLDVVDRSEAERVVEMLNNHVRTTFLQMGVKPVTGDYKPDLALAKGGVPEVAS